MTAKEYWKQRFDEYPQTDADKLAVAMMAEYGREYARLQIEKDRERIKKAFLPTMTMGSAQIVDETPIILD